MTAPRILVTDAHSTSALAVVRSLGAAGMRVTVAGEDRRFNLAAYSRYAHRVVVWPAPEACPLEYLAKLEDELRQTPYDLLLPTTDTTVTLIRHRRATLDTLVRVALPPNDVLEAAQDKALTMRVAAGAGMVVPRTWVLSSMSEVEERAASLPYPCVIKPRFSRSWDGRGPLFRGAIEYARSPEQLVRVFSRIAGGADTVIVQEFIRGAGIGVFVLASEGAPLAVFAHRRVREANPTGGRASLAESIAPDDRLVTPALQVLRALSWTGVAMIEMKDPGAPAPPVLMEVNGRFWGSLPLSAAAGVDFPLMLTRLMLDAPVAPPGPYRIGVRCRHLKGDISYVIAAFKGRPDGWEGPYPSRLGALLATAPWPGRWSSYNLRFDDPAPALREAVDFVMRELGRLRPGGTTSARKATSES